MRSKALLLLASLTAAAAWAGAAGCKKSSSGTGDDTTAATESDASVGARDFFYTKVYPSMQRTCGACHAGQGKASTFLAGTADRSYELISATIGYIAEPGKSPLVQHVHVDKNVTLLPEQRAVFTQWLNMEATARGLSGAVQRAPTLQDAYKKYAECMQRSRDIWEYYRMGDLAFVQTDIDGPCMGCHGTGQASAFLNSNSQLTFEKAREFPYIQKFVVGKVDKNGNFDSLIPAGRFIDKADEPCPEGKTDCHPSFGLPPNVQNSINNFTQTILQSLTDGTCGQPFTPPRDAGPPDAADGGNR